MVKHTRTIRRQFDDELFECLWPFCEIGAWRVKGRYFCKTMFMFCRSKNCEFSGTYFRDCIFIVNFTEFIFAVGRYERLQSKSSALYGLRFTVLDYGFILFNFHLDFVAQNTIKKPGSSSLAVSVILLCKQAFIWKGLLSHCTKNEVFH